MRTRFLAFLANLICRYPRRIIIGAFFITLAASVSIPSLKISAGHSALFSANDVHQKRFQSFLKRFGSPDLLFVLVEGKDANIRRRFINQFEKELNREPIKPLVGNLTIKIYLKELAAILPYFLSEKKLLSIRDKIKALFPLFQKPSLATLFQSAHLFLDEDQQTLPQGKAYQRVLDLSTQTKSLVTRLIKEIKKEQSPMLNFSFLFEEIEKNLSQYGIDPFGYFISRDRLMHLIMVQPKQSSDDPAVILPFINGVKKAASSAQKKIQTDLSLSYAGLPALIADEKESLSRDLFLTTSIAAIFVLLIFIFGFRSLRQGILGFIPLAIALILTLALVRLIFGELNLITSAFLPTVIGLGIDFSLHLLSRFNEEKSRIDNSKQAIRNAIIGSGPALITSGLTTALAFLALVINEFHGFVELGIITALGLFLALLSTLSIGSALLVDERFSFLHRKKDQKEKAHRLLYRFSDFIEAKRFLILGLSLTLVILFTFRGFGIGGKSLRFSYDYLDLLPKNSSAVLAMKELALRTSYSGEISVIEADSKEEALIYIQKLKQKKSVGRIESLAEYLPTDTQNKKMLIDSIFNQLSTIKQSVSIPSRTKAFQNLLDSFEDKLFEANQAHQKDAIKLLNPPFRALKKFAHVIEQSKDSTLIKKNLKRIDSSLAVFINEIKAIIKQSGTIEHINAKTLVERLPIGIAQRLYRDGHYAIYIYPSQSLWNPGFFKSFIQELRQVDPKVTGFTVSHWEANKMIQRGFKQAALMTLLVLVILLWFDFKDLKWALLSLSPLMIAFVWMWGAMSFLQINYNFANIIGFPLVIGIGIASSIHLLHRYQAEGSSSIQIPLTQTGIPIILSALTTMAGFGSLALASHRGASSLGIVLLLGVSFSLLTSIFVLPAVLSFFRKKK